MLVSLSREGVIFLVSLSSSHFTEIHVLPPPVSEANWRSLFWPGDSPPSFPKMASSFTGSAHSPFSGYDTVRTGIVCKFCIVNYCFCFQLWPYCWRQLLQTAPCLSTWCASTVQQGANGRRGRGGGGGHPMMWTAPNVPQTRPDEDHYLLAVTNYLNNSFKKNLTFTASNKKFLEWKPVKELNLPDFLTAVQ